MTKWIGLCLLGLSWTFALAEVDGGDIPEVYVGPCTGKPDGYTYTVKKGPNAGKKYQCRDGHRYPWEVPKACPVGKDCTLTGSVNGTGNGSSGYQGFGGSGTTGSGNRPGTGMGGGGNGGSQGSSGTGGGAGNAGTGSGSGNGAGNGSGAGAGTGNGAGNGGSGAEHIPPSGNGEQDKPKPKPSIPNTPPCPNPSRMKNMCDPSRGSIVTSHGSHIYSCRSDFPDKETGKYHYYNFWTVQDSVNSQYCNGVATIKDRNGNTYIYNNTYNDYRTLEKDVKEDNLPKKDKEEEDNQNKPHVSVGKGGSATGTNSSTTSNGTASAAASGNGNDDVPPTFNGNNDDIGGGAPSTDVGGFSVTQYFRNDGTCPAPVSVNLGLFGSMEISYEWFCQVARQMRGVVIAFAWLAALFIIVGSRRA